MAQCSDKKYKSILHAYELGMLTDDERRELEMHLLDCPVCREELALFSETIRLIRQDEDIREAIQGIGGEEPEPGKSEVMAEQKKPRRLLPTLVPASLVALIVLFILVMKPWQIEIQPTKEAIAARNRLAIMYFNNMADPDDPRHLGEILTNLLITDLAESQFMQVISHQHLYDLLRLLDLNDVKRIDAETATTIAKKANARWMLMGNILQTEPRLVVTSHLIDVETGGVAATQQITGDRAEDIFGLVDELTIEIKNDLSLPPAALQEIDRPVADVTTHSPEAYRSYLEGLNIYYKFFWRGAQIKFEEALSYDSTFAMAYYYLAQLKDSRLIDSAMKYSENASHKERLFISSRKKIIDDNTRGAITDLSRLVERYPYEKLAWYLMGTFYYSLMEYDESVVHLHKAIEIDPLYKAAHNQLAYTYNRMGNLEKALDAINTYIALVPDEANPYDSRGEIYASNGKFEEAIASYRLALEKNPDFDNSISRLSLLYLRMQEYDSAHVYLDRLLSMRNTERKAGVMFAMAYIPQYQGKFNKALRILDDGIAMMKQELGRETHGCYYNLKATIYAERGEWEQALANQKRCIEVERGLYPDRKSNYLDLYTQMLAESGNIEQAEQVADTMRILYEEGSCLAMDYWYALGTIEFARGNMDTAVLYLERADSTTPSFSLSINYMLARACLKAEQYQKAIEVLDRWLAIQDSYAFYWGIWRVKSFYYRGIAHESLGQNEEAIADYTEFIDIWKNADPGIREIEDARVRLEALKAKS